MKVINRPATKNVKAAMKVTTRTVVELEGNSVNLGTLLDVLAPYNRDKTLRILYSKAGNDPRERDIVRLEIS